MENGHTLGQCLLMTKQYHRAANVVTLDVGCCYVAAKSLNMVHNSEEAVDIIEYFLEESLPTVNMMEMTIKTRANLSSLYLLKGLEVRDDRQGAADCYRLAVKTDLTCAEAMTTLTSHQMLSLEEERHLVSGLPLDTGHHGHSPDIVSLASHLYKGSLKKYSTMLSILVQIMLSEQNY